MKEHNIDDCNAGVFGVLKCVTKSSKKGVCKKDIQQKISNYLKDETKTQEILNYIYEQREVIETTKLKRLHPKISLMLPSSN